ncbi:MAG: PDZ domain-containing protein, partial [Stellaceae bacterium]
RPGRRRPVGVERGWIGARIQPVTDEIAESIGLGKGRGAMIAAIDADSPAAEGKLRPGDVILTYDGKPVDRSRQLPPMVADTPPGKTVKVTIWRNGKEAAAALKIVALDPNRPPPPRPQPEKPKPPPTITALGLKLARVTPDLRKQFALPEGARGAVIVDVPQEGAGAAQGLRPGDLIIAVGETPIAAPEQIVQLVATAKKVARKFVLLRVEREDSTRFIALPTEAR